VVRAQGEEAIISFDVTSHSPMSPQMKRRGNTHEAHTRRGRGKLGRQNHTISKEDYIQLCLKFSYMYMYMYFSYE
jgi:hypothetical protein